MNPDISERSDRARRILWGWCALGAGIMAACSDPAAVDTPVSVAPPTQASVVPTSGLVGEWKLDESSGNTAFDTKFNNDAAVNGGAAFVASPLVRALNLNNGTAGVGGKYAEIPNDPTNLQNVTEGNYSISAWFNAITVPTDDSLDNRFWAIVTKAGQTMGLVFNHVGKFSMRHYLSDNTLLIAQGTTIYSTGTWHHVVGAVNRDNGEVKLYVDNVLKSTTTFTDGLAAKDYGTAPFRIGTAQVGIWAANGQVDQVRIYNRELSAADVNGLFTEGSGSAPSVTTNAASPVGMTTATLRGSANPNGLAATGWFRYSKTNPGSCNDTFGTRAPSTGGTSLGSGTGSVAYSRALTGLTAASTYYYCAIASNSQGTSFGTVQFFSMTSAPSGIPFGIFGMRPDTMPNNTIWTSGILSSKGINSIEGQLQAADALNPKIRMWFAMTGPDTDFMSTNGSFNLQLWKDTLSKYADTMSNGVSSHYTQLQPYIENGTFLGILLLDDLPNFTPDPTFAQVEAMAAHAKRMYPGIMTAVRHTATGLSGYSGGAPYTKLDVAWAQYRSDRGPVDDYRDNEIVAAQDVDLGLVLGINITKGQGPFPGGTDISPANLLAWGSELMEAGSSDYVCAFEMWDKTYANLSHANMTTLANLAASHATSTCKRRP